MAENDATFTVQGIESEDDVRDIENELAGVDGVMGTDLE